ncbi:hypothetical protein ACH5RR_039539 [Cinchona calisaya]|uniref:Uncharacterized protein n=1 Tax=Cinchona calisaya TaxID=153742 RepID=A0ABD2Y094_9GENT
MEMHRQEPINSQTIPVESFRQERREEDTASSTQRVSNQGPKVTRTVSRQRSQSIYDQLHPRLKLNMTYCEETPQPQTQMPNAEIMAKAGLRVQ